MRCKLGSSSKNNKTEMKNNKVRKEFDQKKILSK